MKKNPVRISAWLAALTMTTGVVVACGGDDDAVTPTADGGSSVTPDGSVGGSGCAAPGTLCGTSCVSTQTDPANCGACGKACAGGEVCAKGACAVTCPASQTKCDVGGQVTCATLDTDRANCGACGKTCAAGEVCANGTCGLSCPTTYTTCDGRPYVPPPADAGGLDAAPDASDGAAADASPVRPAEAGATAPYCANLQAEEDNCGACGKSCAYDEKCSSGLCCRQGFAGCAGACLDVRTDETNCGGCGVRCGAAQACWGGACRATCPSGGAPVAGKCDEVVDILRPGTRSLTSECGNGSYYSNGVFLLSFTDTTGSVPETMTLLANSGVSCPGTAMTMSLNGVEIGAYAPPTQCTCSPAPAVVTVTVPAAARAAYRPGAVNELLVTGGSQPVGLTANAAWGGAFARVQLRF